MNENSRIFDYIDFQLNRFPKADMFSGKENGVWKNYSTAEVKDTINKLSAGLIKLGVSGNDMTIENQDKIALISKKPARVADAGYGLPANWRCYLSHLSNHQC